MNEHRVQGLMAALGVAVVTLVVGLLAVWTPGWVVVVLASAAAGLATWVVARRLARAHADSVTVLAERLSTIASDHLTPLSSGEPIETLDALESHAEAVSRATHHALRRLGDQLQAFEDLIEAVDVPLMVVDVEGRVLLSNRAACEMLARPVARVLGANLEDLFTEAQVLELLGQARQGQHAAGRVRLSRDGLARVFDSQASPVRVAGGRGVVLSFQDVTDLAIAVQLKTDFVGNASHELRTPIASIRAAVDTLLGPARNDPQMSGRFAEMIRSNVVRLEELVRDLLDLSRFESAEPVIECQEVDMRALAALLAQVFEQVCGDRRIVLTFDVEPTLHRIWTDRSALDLVLRNLIENAIKFSHEGGLVRVVARALDTRAGDKRAVARFEVIDSGVGIPLAHQQRIFERFFQVDQARSGGVDRRGTGLGLAIVKHAVRRLGGTIEVQSVWKQGTTMTVDLPDTVMDEGERAGSEPPRRREAV